MCDEIKEMSFTWLPNRTSLQIETEIKKREARGENSEFDCADEED